LTKVHFYIPGQAFGELALTEKNAKPRAASILATSRSDFAVVSKRDFDTILQEAVKEDFEKKSSVLKNIPAFSHLTKNSLNKKTFSMIEHNIGRGTSLFKEGQNIKGLYLIKNGNFEISRKFKKDLKERYKDHALPVQIRRNIK
jgi:CRP-like cAMP-binding protein